MLLALLPYVVSLDYLAALWADTQQVGRYCSNRNHRNTDTSSIPLGGGGWKEKKIKRKKKDGGTLSNV